MSWGTDAEVDPRCRDERLHADLDLAAGVSPQAVQLVGPAGRAKPMWRFGLAGGVFG